MSAPNFCERYCTQHGITVEKFSEHLLLQACYPIARSMYRLWIKLGRSSLSNELNLLTTIGQSPSLDDVEGMINGVYFSSYLREIKSIRRRLNLRISGSRLIKIAKKCFEIESSD